MARCRRGISGFVAAVLLIIATIVIGLLLMSKLVSWMGRSSAISRVQVMAFGSCGELRGEPDEVTVEVQNVGTTAVGIVEVKIETDRGPMIINASGTYVDGKRVGLGLADVDGDGVADTKLGELGSRRALVLEPGGSVDIHRALPGLFTEGFTYRVFVVYVGGGGLHIATAEVVPS